MPTTLTAPVVQQATHATLDEIEIGLARNPDLSVDAANSQLIVRFRLRRADGSIFETRLLTRAGNELPNPIRTAVVNLHAAIVTAARAAGILPPGVDTPDL